jgi:hypothetical protein
LGVLRMGANREHATEFERIDPAHSNKVTPLPKGDCYTFVQHGA